MTGGACLLLLPYPLMNGCREVHGDGLGNSLMYVPSERTPRVLVVRDDCVNVGHPYVSVFNLVTWCGRNKLQGNRGLQ